jgi:hypothetical protein
VQQRKNIANLKKELDVIKEKQKQLNILQRQIAKDEEDATDEEADDSSEES